VVSQAHEVRHQIFREDWELAPKVATGLGIEFPRCFGATELSPEVNETKVLERRVDTVLRYESEAGPFLMLIESQTSEDPLKPSSWAYYTSYLWTKHKLPTCLMVVCSDRVTERWARKVRQSGPLFMPTLTLQPLVIGPSSMPLISDPEQMRADLKMAALSVITHPDEPGIDAILGSLVTALKGVPDDKVFETINYVAQGLSESAVLRLLEVLVKQNLSYFKSPFTEEIFEKGYVEGEEKGYEKGREECVVTLTNTLLLVLEKRLLQIGPDVRDRIAACDDPEVLGSWLTRAAVVSVAEDIFAEE
jgi:hypothetical protein